MHLVGECLVWQASFKIYLSIYHVAQPFFFFSQVIRESSQMWIFHLPHPPLFTLLALLLSESFVSFDLIRMQTIPEECLINIKKQKKNGMIKRELVYIQHKSWLPFLRRKIGTKAKSFFVQCFSCPHCLP